jgi:hypothetical protein
MWKIVGELLMPSINKTILESLFRLTIEDHRQNKEVIAKIREILQNKEDVNNKLKLSKEFTQKIKEIMINKDSELGKVYKEMENEFHKQSHIRRFEDSLTECIDCLIEALAAGIDDDGSDKWIEDAIKDYYNPADGKKEDQLVTFYKNLLTHVSSVGNSTRTINFYLAGNTKIAKDIVRVLDPYRKNSDESFALITSILEKSLTVKGNPTAKMDIEEKLYSKNTNDGAGPSREGSQRKAFDKEATRFGKLVEKLVTKGATTGSSWSGALFKSVALGALNRANAAGKKNYEDMITNLFAKIFSDRTLIPFVRSFHELFLKKIHEGKTAYETRIQIQSDVRPIPIEFEIAGDNV